MFQIEGDKWLLEKYFFRTRLAEALEYFYRNIPASVILKKGSLDNKGSYFCLHFSDVNGGFIASIVGISKAEFVYNPQTRQWSVFQSWGEKRLQIKDLSLDRSFLQHLFLEAQLCTGILNPWFGCALVKEDFVWAQKFIRKEYKRAAIDYFKKRFFKKEISKGDRIKLKHLLKDMRSLYRKEYQWPGRLTI